MMPDLIYLVGYMYSGKTTFGRQLAQQCGYDFVDLDNAFEQYYHTTIALFFQHYDEQAFRLLERQMLHRTATLHHTVVSTGGGTPCFFDNMQFINQHGTAIYLALSPEHIMQRMNRSHKPRPLFAGLTQQQRENTVRNQLQTRLPFYQQAAITIDALRPDADAVYHLLLNPATN